MILLASAVLLLSITVFLRSSHAGNICKVLTNPTSALNFSPTNLTATDVVVIFIAILSKSFLALIGLFSSLQVSPDGQGFLLPNISISAPLNISPENRKSYEKAISSIRPANSRISDDQPSLLLAASTTPLMILALGHFSSPILPLGSVNTKNRFEFISSSNANASLMAHASFGGSSLLGRRTKRGIEFDIVIEVYEANKAKNLIVFRQIITIMQRLPKSTKPVFEESKPAAPTTFSSSNRTTLSENRLHLVYHAPSLWWVICKDYNPIHVSSMVAKLFGLPGRIAHGNHVAAAALQQILENTLLRDHNCGMEVAFERPMVLPLDFSLQTYQGDSTIIFNVQKNEKVYVSGHLFKL